LPASPMPSTPWLPWRLAVPIAAALASVPFILPLVLPLLLRSNASPRALSVNRLTWLPSPAIRTATTVSPPLAPLLSPSQPSAPSPPVIHMSPSPSPPPPSPPASLAPPSPPMIQAPRSPPPPPPIQAPLSPPSQSIQAPHPPPPPHSSSPPPPESMATDEKAGETETRRCDVYDGEWVQDEEARPLYPPGTCPYVDEAYACAANGRPDSRYTRWRWAPRHCSLPRYLPSTNPPTHRHVLPHHTQNAAGADPRARPVGSTRRTSCIGCAASGCCSWATR
jgi:hypothetical protein